MIVCGIDPSLTNTGIAVLFDGKPLVLHSIGHGGRSGATYAQRSDRIVSQARSVVQWIDDRCQGPLGVLPLNKRVDLVVMEGPAYGQNLPSNHDRAGLWWGLFSAFRARKVPVAVCTPTTRAIWATGKGRADKKVVLAEVRSWWPDVKIPNHDIADAAVLALCGAVHLGDPAPFELKERHHIKLGEIAWPDRPEGTA